MCLALPGRVVAVSGVDATVEISGNTLLVDCSLLSDVVPGDYLIIHAGIAIQKYDENEALETIALFQELTRLMERPKP